MKQPAINTFRQLVDVAQQCVGEECPDCEDVILTEVGPQLIKLVDEVNILLSKSLRAGKRIRGFECSAAEIRPVMDALLALIDAPKETSHE